MRSSLGGRGAVGPSRQGRDRRLVARPGRGGPEEDGRGDESPPADEQGDDVVAPANQEGQQRSHEDAAAHGRQDHPTAGLARRRTQGAGLLAEER